MHEIDPSEMTPSPSSPPASIYIAGLFAMGYTEFYIFLIPLYALSLGMSAGEVGMLVGGRSLLAVFLSIHVGVLMDRLGTRRVTLFFVWMAMAIAPLFPLVPWFWALLLMQVLNGAALQFAWSGLQTLIAQLADGEAEFVAQLRLQIIIELLAGGGQIKYIDRGLALGINQSDLDIASVLRKSFCNLAQQARTILRNNL